MMTGSVSDFERYQSARIEQFGLPGALKRQALPDFLYLDEASPDDLVGRFTTGMLLLGVASAVDLLARQLRKDLDRRPDPYAFLRQVFQQLPNSYEDNVAAA